MFGKWPWEVDLLPFHHFARVRRYFFEVKRQEREAAQKPVSDEVNDLNWDADVITSLR